MATETTELFYIGDDFYPKSGTVMSSIYTVEGRFRFDWGFVQRDLASGKSVTIRPATPEEMKWAQAKLTEIRDRLPPHCAADKEQD